MERASSSAAETAAIGEALGRAARPGDVLALDGPLGAGKTCLVQGLARGLGIPADARVTSPTFTLVNEHLGGRLPLYHIDLYRLERADEALEIGLPEYLAQPGVAAVEWFARFPELMPPDLLVLAIEIVSDEERRLRLTARGGAAGWLERAKL